MFYLLIILSFILIARTLYVAIYKRRLSKIPLIFSILTIGFLALSGVRITASGTLPHGTKLIESVNTTYGKAFLYEDKNAPVFGIASAHRVLGVFYYNYSRTNGYLPEDDVPFEVIGLEVNEGGSSQGEDSFTVGVMAIDSDIRYIVIGNHFDEEEAHYLAPYEFNMETIEAHTDGYIVKEIDSGYALFTFDRFSEKTWTIRALDKDGNLMADKLFWNGESRYIDW